MPDSTDSLPWMNDWLRIQRQLLDQAAKAPGGNDGAMRRLSGFAGDYVEMAGDWWRHFGASAASPMAAQPLPDPETWYALFSDRYRRLFTPEFASNAAAPDPLRGDGAATLRWHAATRRFGQQAAAIAVDASQRFARLLLSDDAGLPPVTTLRQLHELWIECGEAAYAAAASGDEFVDAQVELLTAWVELRALQRRART